MFIHASTVTFAGHTMEKGAWGVLIILGILGGMWLTNKSGSGSGPRR